MYIRPHLDYCDVIYHIPPLSDQYCSSITLRTLMESIEYPFNIKMPYSSLVHGKAQTQTNYIMN